jgi:ParB-like chromosome segregation protein Spo0J
MTSKYEYHPIANLFPLMEGDEYQALVEDIKDRGLQEPIILYEGKILDGRNRYRACVDAGVEIKLPLKIKTYDGKDPVGLVLTANLHRRHLDAGQRAVVAAELTNLEKGANQYSEGITIERAAELFNVGRGSIDRARKLLKVADPEVVQEVKEGKQSVSGALNKTKKKKKTNKPSGDAQAEDGGEKKKKQPDLVQSVKEKWAPITDLKQQQDLIKWLIFESIGWQRVSDWLQPEFEIVRKGEVLEAAE